MGKGGGGQSQSVEVKVMGVCAVEQPAGDGCQGKEAGGNMGVLTISQGSVSLKITPIKVENAKHAQT